MSPQPKSLSESGQTDTPSRLNKAEAQLRLMTKVFMDSADPIVIRDLDGRVLDMNSEVERVFGWKRDEMIGRRTTHLLDPECQKAAEEIHKRRLKGETVRNFETIVQAESG